MVVWFEQYLQNPPIKAVLLAEAPLTLTGTAQQPTLLVYDLGTSGPTAPPPLGRWQTQLTLLRQLDPNGLPQSTVATCHAPAADRSGGGHHRRGRLV